MAEALTPREAEVLAAVGRRLTNPEIADELVLSVRTVESHVAALRRKLEVSTRAGLVAAGRARAAAAVVLPPTSLVGRAVELAELPGLLSGTRLLTITGPAGCGKTRLARELAARGPAVPVVVELDRVPGPGVAAAVAAGVGVGVRTGAGGDPLAAAAVALGARAHLLVLDDCDRVAGPVAAAVAALLARAPALRVLVTARGPLGVAGETVHPLAPLPTGPDEPDGAVRLFRDRAATAAPGLVLTAADDRLVAGICRRLDGLPLAVELAAARMRQLPLAELAAALHERLDLLGAPGAPHRHSTLDAAFAWSWDLLDTGERTVLTRLAALPRTFDLALAEVVGGPGRVVLRLVDRSLLVGAGGRPRRFRLLAALRAFVLDRADPDLVREVRRTHAAHHAALAGELAARIRTDDGVELADRARAAVPEIAAALGWTVVDDPGSAPGPAAALAALAEHLGPDPGILEAIAAAVRAPGVRAAALPAELLAVGGALAYYSLDLLDEVAALALARVSDPEGDTEGDTAPDPAAELAARHLAGIALAYAGRGAAALEHLDRAEELAVALDHGWQRAAVLQTRGTALRAIPPDGPARALDAFAAAVEAYALAGDAMHVSNARYMLAHTAAAAGVRLVEAAGWAEQSLAYARERGHVLELAHARLTLASLTAPERRGELVEAALEAFRAVGDLRCATRCYLRLAEGRPAAAAVGPLERALEVTAAAGDRRRRAEVLGRLVRAHWERGAAREAALALGALTGLVGAERARQECPPELAEQLGTWQWAVAEGRARATGAG